MNVVVAVVTLTVAELVELLRALLDGPCPAPPGPVVLSGSFGPQSPPSPGPIPMPNLDHTVTVGDGPFVLTVRATRHAHADAFAAPPTISFADGGVLFAATVAPGPAPDVYLVNFADPATAGATAYTVTTADGKATLTGTLTAVAGAPDAIDGSFGDQTPAPTPAPTPVASDADATPATG